MEKKKNNIWFVGLFTLGFIFNFFVMVVIVYLIVHFGLHQTALPKWAQFLTWTCGFSFGFIYLFFKFFRDHWLEIAFLSLAVIYLLTVIFVPEGYNNNFADTLKDFVFIVGLPLLPYRIKDAVSKLLETPKEHGSLN